jgi:hypothetical protein
VVIDILVYPPFLFISSGELFLDVLVDVLTVP